MATRFYRNTGIRYLSEEWETARDQLGIGGSEAAAIAGMNPYSSALSVYFAKTGHRVPVEVNEAMRQGSELEEYVAKRFCEETGKRVKRQGYLLQSKLYPFMLADIDRVVIGENSLLECKTTLNRDGYTYEDAENIPAYQLVQSLHYMIVYGADTVYLATLVYGRGFHTVEIHRSDFVRDIQSLIEIERRFWEENVQKGQAPAPDGSADCAATLLSEYPSADEDQPPKDLMGYASQLYRLSELKRELAGLTEEKAGIENQLKAALGTAPAGEYGTFRVTWKNRTSTRLDTTALKKEMPDVYAKFATTSESRTFLFTEKN